MKQTALNVVSCMMIIYSTTVSLFNTITEHIHTLNKSGNVIKNKYK